MSGREGNRVSIGGGREGEGSGNGERIQIENRETRGGEGNTASRHETCADLTEGCRSIGKANDKQVTSI